MFLELSLPLYSQYAVQVLSLSTVLKSIVGVAGGATRAALTQHQVKEQGEEKKSFKKKRKTLRNHAGENDNYKGLIADVNYIFSNLFTNIG